MNGLLQELPGARDYEEADARADHAMASVQPVYPAESSFILMIYDQSDGGDRQHWAAQDFRRRTEPLVGFVQNVNCQKEAHHRVDKRRKDLGAEIAIGFLGGCRLLREVDR